MDYFRERKVGKYSLFLCTGGEEIKRAWGALQLPAQSGKLPGGSDTCLSGWK